MKTPSLQAEAPKGPTGKAAVVIRGPYFSPRVRQAIYFDPKQDRTQQSFRDECDINVLMKRYEQTGILPQGKELPAQFADVSAMDFTESMNQVAVVRGVFSQLGARVRARFENDPGVFLAFVSDDANRGELEKLGLMRPKAAVPENNTPENTSPAQPAS